VHILNNVGEEMLDFTEMIRFPKVRLKYKKLE